MRKCKSESNCCGNEENDCCTSVSVFLKLNNDFRSAENQKVEIPSTNIAVLIAKIIFSPINYVSIKNKIIDTSPPVLSDYLSFLQAYRI